jgi:hypothetical protein
MFVSMELFFVIVTLFCVRTVDVAVPLSTVTKLVALHSGSRNILSRR